MAENQESATAYCATRKNPLTRAAIYAALILFVLYQAERRAELELKGAPPNKLIIAPEFWREIETHCVAVLTEAHVEERPVATYGDIPPEVRDGKAIIHVPEQTLKLRCK
jgi:hypothetical protein